MCCEITESLRVKQLPSPPTVYQLSFLGYMYYQTVLVVGWCTVHAIGGGSCPRD